MRVMLIGCSATKDPSATVARDLYTGELHRLSRRLLALAPPGVYVGWGILSARYGLLLPDTPVDAYDLSMSALGSEERRAWDDRVAQQLTNEWGGGAIYTVYAGADYTGWARRFPAVELVYRHWAEQHAWKPTRSRFGLGHIKRRLIAEVKLRESCERLRRWADGEDWDGICEDLDRRAGLLDPEPEDDVAPRRAPRQLVDWLGGEAVAHG